jgi:hypothetical protein
MLAGLKGYKLVRILFGVFQKVRIRLLGTLEKSISKSFQKSFVLWQDICFLTITCLSVYWEKLMWNFNLGVIQKSETLI